MTVQPVRVMHIRDSSGIYGAERVILGLFKEYDRSLFNISLLCMRRGNGGSDPLIAEAQKLGVTVHTVDVGGKFDIAALIFIRKLFFREKVTIIHSHDFKSDFYGWVSSIFLNISRVSTAHGSTRDSFFKKIYLFLNEKLIWKRFNKIIAVSSDIERTLLTSGLRRKQVALVRNGLDLDSFSQNIPETPNILPIVDYDIRKTTFAVVGRLYPDKGHILFIEAFYEIYKENTEIQALIVGDGPHRDAICQRIRDFDLDKKIHMLGVRDDMKELYRNIDCLVIASLREGLPYVLLEAMAMNVNVLATEVGEIPKILSNKVNGLLIEAGKVDTLVQGMKHYLNSPPETRELWKKSAKSIVLNEYSAEKMSRVTESIYSNL